MARTPNPLAIKSLGPSGQPNVDQWASTVAAEKEPQSAYGPGIAQTALQSVGMSTRSIYGPFIGPPEYALAVSLIFTKATEQTIMLGTPPNHVCSTSILWNSLAHDKRFTQVAMSEAAPGDIIIEPGWQKAADGYAGIVVDHGRIVSNSSQGVQNDSSLIEIRRNRQEMAIFRHIGVQRHRSYPLANEGYNDAEPRLPAGQPGGGQWTSGGASPAAPSKPRDMTMELDPPIASNPISESLELLGLAGIPGLVKGVAGLVEAGAKGLAGLASDAVGGIAKGEASQIVTGGGLKASEDAGGHLLAKHVGQTDAQLMSRAMTDPKTPGLASSFLDQATAEAAGSQAIDANSGEIAKWLGAGKSDTLTIRGTLNRSVGKIVTNEGAPATTSSSTFVLVRDPNVPAGYHILTGYPF